MADERRVKRWILSSCHLSGVVADLVDDPDGTRSAYVRLDVSGQHWKIRGVPEDLTTGETVTLRGSLGPDLRLATLEIDARVDLSEVDDAR